LSVLSPRHRCQQTMRPATVTIKLLIIIIYHCSCYLLLTLLLLVVVVVLLCHKSNADSTRLSVHHHLRLTNVFRGMPPLPPSMACLFDSCAFGLLIFVLIAFIYVRHSIYNMIITIIFIIIRPIILLYLTLLSHRGNWLQR